MIKSLFNYSLYSHPEIGNFRVWHKPSLVVLSTYFAEKHNRSLLLWWYSSVTLPLTRPSHLTSLLGRDLNLHPFRKEMSSFFFRLDFLIPTDRSFCLSLAEYNHVWLGIGYPRSFYPRRMVVCARWSKKLYSCVDFTNCIGVSSMQYYW
jgi:hypothetical protein